MDTDRLPSSRKRLFWLILLIIPPLLITAAELILRAFDYGGNLDLVVKKTVLGSEYYTLNRNVARRYFSQKGIAVPEAYDDIFEIKKSPATKRIFMLGESTMAGFPFDYNATAPRLVRDRLVRLLPQYNIEVINAGLSAVNSYTVRDFVKELVDYEPDAFIVYLGHNEFYGAMGIGSTEYLGQWRWLVNVYIDFRQFRLFLLVRDGIVALRTMFGANATPRDATLMEVMVRDRAIPYNSKEYSIARENFKANLLDIIAVAKKKRVPVILSSLVSNIRDQRPLFDVFDEASSLEDRFIWGNLVDHGEAALQIGNVEDALVRFDQAIRIDTMNAQAHFLLAKCLDTLGRYPEAKREYEKARDYDGLRFRASSDFNELIETVCREQNIPMADAEEAFEQHSPGGLVGSNFMLEHLHPNFDGYFLLAKTFFKCIVDNDLVAPPPDWRWDRDLPDEEFKKLAGVTQFDMEAAKFRILNLTSGWPFQKTDGARQQYRPQDKIQELAARYVQKRVAWSQARYDLAEWFIQQGRYDPAHDEFYAVSKIIPYAYYPLMRMGEVRQRQGRSDAAETLYKKALSAQESPFVHVRLGVLYFEQGKTGEAIEQFEATIRTERKETMNVRDQSMARYFLGAAYGKSGDLQKARANLQLALQVDPNNQEARRLLGLIP